MYKYELKNINLSQMKKLAIKLSNIFTVGDVVALNGDLGAGKSTLARFIIQSFLGDKTNIPSPTFTLVQTYKAKKNDIWHMDLYRLEEPEQIIELGVEEAFSSSLCLIEWAEKGQGFLPNDIMNINIENGDSINSRNIIFLGDKFKQKNINKWINGDEKNE